MTYSFKNTLNEFIRFLDYVKSTPKIDIFNYFNLGAREFEKRTLLDNLSAKNIGRGVTEVQVCQTQTNKVLNLFDKIVIKKYNNGQTQYAFHTQSRDFWLISCLSKMFFSELGQGVMDDGLKAATADVNELGQLIKDFFNKKTRLSHFWKLKNFLIMVCYENLPKSRFILNLFENPLDPTKEHSLLDILRDDNTNKVRNNGNILDLINIDLIDYVYDQDDLVEVENSLKSFHSIHPPELGVFNRLELEFMPYHHGLSYEEPIFACFKSSNLRPSVHQMIHVVNRLVEIYEGDFLGRKELTYDELEDFDKRCVKLNRLWNFDKNHKIWESNQKDAYNYSVFLEYHYNECLSLRISHLNKLLIQSAD